MQLPYAAEYDALCVVTHSFHSHHQNVLVSCQSSPSVRSERMGHTKINDDLPILGPLAVDTQQIGSEWSLTDTFPMTQIEIETGDQKKKGQSEIKTNLWVCP